MQYNTPSGPVVSTGVVAVGALGTMHSMLLAVTIVFTLLLVVTIVRRTVRKAQR